MASRCILTKTGLPRIIFKFITAPAPNIGGSAVVRLPQQEPTINPIVFGFDRKCKLTDLKIVPLSDIETNKYPQPIWHLVSESNSVPVKSFMYGSRIGGMHPAIKDAKPEPLEPGVTYRLFVQTTTEKAQHDFVPDPRAQ